MQMSGYAVFLQQERMKLAGDAAEVRVREEMETRRRRRGRVDLMGLCIVFVVWFMTWL